MNEKGTRQAEVEAHSLTSNVNEATVEDADKDVEAHGLNYNVNEAAVEDES